MPRLKLGPGKVDQKATETLRKIKPKARSQGDLNGAVLQAAFYAKKLNDTMWGYSGNSYMVAVWRVSYKPSEYLDPVNNTGGRIFSVSPDLTVTWYEIKRPKFGATDTPPRKQASNIALDVAREVFDGKPPDDGQWNGRPPRVSMDFLVSGQPSDAQGDQGWGASLQGLSPARSQAWWDRWWVDFRELPIQALP